MERKPGFEVVVPGKQAAIDRLPLVPLSVHEAFRYTPLTTSPLNVSDAISLPSLSLRHGQRKLVSDGERKAISCLQPGHQVQQKIQSLLNPSDLAEIKFKRSPTSTTQPTKLPKLSPLANAILDGVRIDFTYPVQKSNVTRVNLNAHSANRLVTSSKQPTLPPASATLSTALPNSSQLSIEITQPDNFRRKDYAVATDSPKRRKLNNEARDAEVALRRRTQKEQGDAAVSRLHDLLADIFEEENTIDPSSGNIPAGAHHFDVPDADEDFALRLTSPTLAKLQQSLRQLVALKRLPSVPATDLQGLQRLCSPTITNSSSLHLASDPSSSEEDQITWLHKLAKVENGASSASVFLYSYLGGQPEDANADPDTIRAIPSLLKNCFENVLIPVVECRRDPEGAGLFELATANSEPLKKLLDSSRNLLEVLTSACVQLQTARDCVSQTEFLASSLIFAQNASTDKAAALGTQNYERVRQKAMEALARIFAAFPEDRPAILDSILSSLDRLPSTSRSARQFKYSDGKSIMLISALFIQLVQTASLENSRNRVQRKSGRKGQTPRDPDDEEDQSTEENENRSEDASANEEDEKAQLTAKADALYNPAVNNAKDIVNYLINKASTASKTGDSPYRNILDLFIEDMVGLLLLPEWPAAELLLRLLANKMIDLTKHENRAGVKNMALESLGTIGSAISVSRAAVQDLVTNMSRESETGSEDMTPTLLRLAEHHLSVGSLQNSELVVLDGPLGLISRYYQIPVKGSQKLRAKSARSFHLAQYALLLSRVWDSVLDTNQNISFRLAGVDILGQIADVASDAEPTISLDPISLREAHLAYLLGVLNIGLCRRYEVIARTLLLSLSSDQAQVRSRSLKSVVTILETDPSLLDRDPAIADDVFRCASDDSAMVRDASLSLIAKFIISRPALEEKGIRRLLECAEDVKVGVQKRAIGHLGDIYAQDKRPTLKAAIARTFLRRTKDFEESVNELAKKSLADAWISPNLKLMNEPAEAAKSKVAMEALCAHITDTLSHDEDELPVLLTSFVKGLLKMAKSSSNLVNLLDRLVEVLFQSIISGSATSTSLTTLMSLSEARPESVAPQQLSHLRRYLDSVSADDLPMFKSVITIFRHVLPRLSASHQTLLREIQADLLKSINRLARRADLDEVMSCLKTIGDILHSNPRYGKLLTSVLRQICDVAVNDNTKTKLIRIAGSMGKKLDVDALDIGELKEYRGGPVSGFLTDAIYKNGLLCQRQPLELVALESLGAICQSSPSQFNKQHIDSMFRSAIDPNDRTNTLLDKSRGQLVVLRALDELFAALAASSKANPDAEAGAADEIQDLKKMGGSSKTQDDNSAISTLANAIKKPLVAVALRGQGETASLAVRTLASLAERGMFHPKDYAGAFIALETSEDPELKNVAIKSHQLAHQHHESHFEREYMQAIQQAFIYQKGLFPQPSGIMNGKAKLGPCFNVINTSGPTYVRKFLTNLVSRLNTDYTKMDITKEVPDHVCFVRFIADNIAYFDYARLDDLLHVTLELELLFSKNGTEIGQAIELNIKLEETPPPIVEHDDAILPDVTETAPAPTLEVIASTVDPILLKRLAAAACAVTIIYEATMYLKRQYGLAPNLKAYMIQQKQSKEGIKAPTRIHGITGDRFVTASTSVLSSLSSEQEMIARCKQFLHVMSVDEETRVAEDGQEYRDDYSAGVDMEGVQPVVRGRKRKSGPGSAAGTPKKPRGRPRKSGTSTVRRSTSISSREDPEAEYWD